VKLVVSDAHEGLVGAIEAVLLGATWQRCRGALPAQRAGEGAQGFGRDGPGRDRHDLRPARRRPRHRPVRSGHRHARASVPCRRAMLAGAREDLLAFSAFPVAHWKRIWSTNPLERLHKEIKHRTDVVGIFPNEDALMRLVTAVIAETRDDWAVTDRRYLSEASMKALRTTRQRHPGRASRCESIMNLKRRPLCRDLSPVRDTPGTRDPHDPVARVTPRANITATSTPRITTTYTTQRGTTSVACYLSDPLFCQQSGHIAPPFAALTLPSPARSPCHLKLTHHNTIKQNRATHPQRVLQRTNANTRTWNQYRARSTLTAYFFTLVCQDKQKRRRRRYLDAGTLAVHTARGRQPKR